MKYGIFLLKEYWGYIIPVVILAPCLYLLFLFTTNSPKDDCCFIAEVIRSDMLPRLQGRGHAGVMPYMVTALNQENQRITLGSQQHIKSGENLCYKVMRSSNQAPNILVLIPLELCAL